MVLRYQWAGGSIALISIPSREEKESYDDSDQTPLQGREAIVLSYQWAGGSIALISITSRQEKESYEDSDQTPLQGQEAIVLSYQWALAGGSLGHRIGIFISNWQSWAWRQTKPSQNKFLSQARFLLKKR